MEQKQNLEKPHWVKLIDELPEATRQTIGNICASTIQNLAVIALVSVELYEAVCDVAYAQTKD